MKTNLLSIDGKKLKEITLPEFFEYPLRMDLISKVLEAKKYKQPHSPSPVAGKQHSAKGKIVHRRHVWRSGYGRGISRVPRKIFSQRGSNFNWEAAEVPFARGGMRAHPPKILSMINFLKINKKESKIALLSALSATTNGKIISERYATLNGKKLENFPIIIESKLENLKTKNLLAGLKKILGEDLFKLAVQKKTVRAGKGKMRGRKYKSNAGLLLVKSSEEKFKTTAFEVVNANVLGVTDLAKGGPGRITIYSEKSLKELENKLIKKSIKK